MNLACRPLGSRIIGAPWVTTVASRRLVLGPDDSRGVTVCTSHGEPEQIAEPPQVAGGGVRLVEDAVLADGLARHPEALADPPRGDCAGGEGTAVVDEQVRIGG